MVVEHPKDGYNIFSGSVIEHLCMFPAFSPMVLKFLIVNIEMY